MRSILSDHLEIMAVMGPTASGKTAYAIDYAKTHNGEVISVDSMQIYRGLEIGTAQPTMTERAGIPHHLIGIYDIAERIDVFTFQELADQKIAEIAARGKLPILAGGSGMYLKAILYGLDDLPADRDLRNQLDRQFAAEEQFPDLKQYMSELDPQALERFGQCQRRLIRALEVKILTGRSIVELQKNQTPRLRYPTRAVKFDRDATVMKERILARARLMLKQGWIEEAQGAIARGLLASPTAYQAIGYALIGQYLDNAFDLEMLTQKIATQTWQYARRQRTWFRHQHPEAETILS